MNNEQDLKDAEKILSDLLYELSRPGRPKKDTLITYVVRASSKLVAVKVGNGMGSPLPPALEMDFSRRDRVEVEDPANALAREQEETDWRLERPQY